MATTADEIPYHLLSLEEKKKQATDEFLNLCYGVGQQESVVCSNQQIVDYIRNVKLAGRDSCLMLNAAAETIAQQLNASDSHFLLELLQNCDDNEYTVGSLPKSSAHIEIRLAKDILLVTCNEIGMCPENINALCDIGNSSKKLGHGESERYVGEKGIGFKSVFKAAETVEIYSCTDLLHLVKKTERVQPCRGPIDSELPLWRFSLTEKPTNLPGYITPSALTDVPADVWQIFEKMAERPNPIGCTVMRFHLKPAKTALVEKELSLMRPETIMFLQKLETVNIECNGIVATISCERTSATSNIMTVSGTYDGKNTRAEYFVSKKTVDMSQHGSRLRLGAKDRTITVAVPIATTEPLAHHVFAYLPTSISTSLPFLLQADFLLVASRDAILLNERWNEHLFAHIPAAVEEAARKMVDAGYFDPVMRLVPVSSIRGDPFEAVCANIIARLKGCPILEPLVQSTRPRAITPKEALYFARKWTGIFRSSNAPCLQELPIIKEYASDYRGALRALIGDEVRTKSTFERVLSSVLKDIQKQPLVEHSWFASLYQTMSSEQAYSSSPSGLPIICLEGQSTRDCCNPSDRHFFPTSIRSGDPSSEKLLKLVDSNILFIHSDTVPVDSWDREQVINWLTRCVGVKTVSGLNLIVDTCKLLSSSTPPHVLIEATLLMSTIVYGDRYGDSRYDLNTLRYVVSREGEVVERKKTLLFSNCPSVQLLSRSEDQTDITILHPDYSAESPQQAACLKLSWRICPDVPDPGKRFSWMSPIPETLDVKFWKMFLCWVNKLASPSTPLIAFIKEDRWIPTNMGPRMSSTVYEPTDELLYAFGADKEAFLHAELKCVDVLHTYSDMMRTCTRAVALKQLEMYMTRNLDACSDKEQSEMIGCIFGLYHFLQSTPPKPDSLPENLNVKKCLLIQFKDRWIWASPSECIWPETSIIAVTVGERYDLKIVSSVLTQYRDLQQWVCSLGVAREYTPDDLIAAWEALQNSSVHTGIEDVMRHYHKQLLKLSWDAEAARQLNATQRLKIWCGVNGFRSRKVVVCNDRPLEAKKFPANRLFCMWTYEEDDPKIGIFSKYMHVGLLSKRLEYQVLGDSVPNDGLRSIFPRQVRFALSVCLNMFSKPTLSTGPFAKLLHLPLEDSLVGAMGVTLCASFVGLGAEDLISLGAELGDTSAPVPLASYSLPSNDVESPPLFFDLSAKSPKIYRTHGSTTVEALESFFTLLFRDLDIRDHRDKYSIANAIRAALVMTEAQVAAQSCAVPDGIPDVCLNPSSFAYIELPEEEEVEHSVPSKVSELPSVSHVLVERSTIAQGQRRILSESSLSDVRVVDEFPKIAPEPYQESDSEEEPTTSHSNFTTEVSHRIVHLTPKPFLMSSSYWWQTTPTALEVYYQKMREQALKKYGCCMISGTTSQIVLTACHIMPVESNGLDVVDNILLLREDLHRLFDNSLLYFVPSPTSNGECKVWLSADIRKDPAYAQFHLRLLHPAAGSPEGVTTQFLNKGTLSYLSVYRKPPSNAPRECYPELTASTSQVAAALGRMRLR